MQQLTHNPKFKYPQKKIDNSKTILKMQDRLTVNSDISDIETQKHLLEQYSQKNAFKELETYPQTDILFEIQRLNKLLNKKKETNNNIMKLTKSSQNKTDPFNRFGSSSRKQSKFLK